MTIHNNSKKIFPKNSHLQTLAGAFIRSTPKVNYTRKTVNTPDGDFIDVDTTHSEAKAKTAVIISHGLEGSSNSSYALSLAKYANDNKCDAFAWNMRGCSGRPNKFLSSYHSGFTDDLKTVVDWINSTYKYEELILIGISIGGCITIRYLGESGSNAPSNIKNAIAISPPCDLADCAETLSTGLKRIYMYNFLVNFYSKLREKRKLYPDELRSGFFKGIWDFYSYDSRFTAPWFGFSSADEYWEQASAKHLIPEVKIPLTILTSMDDPFFTKRSIPIKESKENKFVSLQVVSHGGHVGFYNLFNDSFYEGIIKQLFSQDYYNP